MSLPQVDMDYLSVCGYAFQVSDEANMTCVVFNSYKLPAGYDRAEADLLIRISAGYPDVPPDMWWLTPAIHLSNGTTVQATEQTEIHLGRPWQRWSRHFPQGRWLSGVDSIESYLALIRKELQKWVPASARA